MLSQQKYHTIYYLSWHTFLLREKKYNCCRAFISENSYQFYNFYWQTFLRKQNIFCVGYPQTILKNRCILLSILSKYVLRTEIKQLISACIIYELFIPFLLFVFCWFYPMKLRKCLFTFFKSLVCLALQTESSQRKSGNLNHQKRKTN